jgi:tRNA-2-methylthio-N6-dimethylallyladenosine synthase
MVRKYAKWNSEQWVNKIVPVLVEGLSKTNKSTSTGYSPEWKVVNFSGKAKVGEIKNILITSASRFSLNGKVIE